jgi:hypothetical protein
MERFKGACTDWTSYAEINRPNCLILGRFAVKQGANRFGRLILANQKLSPHGLPGSSSANQPNLDGHFSVNLGGAFPYCGTQASPIPRLSPCSSSAGPPLRAEGGSIFGSTRCSCCVSVAVRWELSRLRLWGSLLRSFVYIRASYCARETDTYAKRSFTKSSLLSVST